MPSLLRPIYCLPGFAALGAGILVLTLAGIKLHEAGSSATDVEVCWFPFAVTVGAAQLIVQGLLGLIGVCSPSPAALNIATGISLVLIPTELIWMGLARTHLPWMEGVGLRDESGLLLALLRYRLRHPSLSDGLAWLVVGAQGLFPILALKESLTQKRRRYPWSQAWEQPRGARDAAESVLRRGVSSATLSQGYFTPRSRPASPEVASPARPPRSPARLPLAALDQPLLLDARGDRAGAGALAPKTPSFWAPDV